MSDPKNPLPREPQDLNSPGQPPPSRAELEMLLGPSRLLTIQEYATLMRDIPFPTASQRENFVEHITTAHKWYKHLPRYLPGDIFHLFLDRFAGCEWQAGFFVERKTRNGHYSELPTAEHRARFGFLSYCFDEIETTLRDRDRVPWIELSTRLGRQPQLVDAGRVEVTAVIHPLSHHDHYWDYRVSEYRHRISWPEESGGETTLNKIWKRCAEMRQPEYKLEENQKKRKEAMDLLFPRDETYSNSYYYLRSRSDPVLYELLEPERTRQKKEMLKAIDRICTLIHDARPSP